MTFKELKEIAKITYSIEDKTGLRAFCNYIGEYSFYFKEKYPEISSYIDSNYQMLPAFNNEKDFVKAIIYKYDIDPLELLGFNRDEMINTYIESKLHKI